MRMTTRTVGISTASANLLRSLGGSIGTAAFGAVFAAHSVQTVFLGAAPVAIAGLLVVLLLEEVPLGGPATAKGA
jgi:hypothetical protein